MSRKVIVNGESICYLPPVDASEISFVSSGVLLSDNVQDVIEEINLKQGGDINGHLFIDNHDGTTSTTGESVLLVGNNIAEGTDGNSRGRIRLFANTSNNLDIMPPQDMSVSRQVWFPVPSDNNQTLALRSDLDIQSLTFSAPAFSDTSNIKVTRTGKIIKISFSGVTLNTAIGKYGEVMTGLPINRTGYSVGIFFDQNDNDKQISFYLNDNHTNVQTNDALPVGAKIWGSFIYFG